MKSNKRLREVIDIIKEKHGFTNEEVSKALGYRSDTYVSDILGGTKPANKFFLQRLENYFDVNIDYIEKDSGDPFNNSSNVSESKPTYTKKLQEQKLNGGPYMVPLVPVSAQAGYSKSYANTDYLNKLEYYPMVPGVDPHGAIWRYFQIDGDSMLSFLNDGDYVLSNQVAREDWQEVKDFQVYVIVTDDLVTIKRVYKRKKGEEIVLIPENEKYPQVAINLEKVKEIWRYRRHIGWNASSTKKFEIKI